MITVLFVTGLLQANAQAYGQRITLNKNNASLEEILVEITRQSDYLYSATTASLQKSKLVNIHIKNADIDEVLTLCFKEQPLTYSLLSNVIIVKEKSDISPDELTILPVIKGNVIGDPHSTYPFFDKHIHHSNQNPTMFQCIPPNG